MYGVLSFKFGEFILPFVLVCGHLWATKRMVPARRVLVWLWLWLFVKVQGKGVWGTGTRRKRAAEREFGLPAHLENTISRPVGKSFEELQEEAMARERAGAEVDVEGEVGDGALNDVKVNASGDVGETEAEAAVTSAELEKFLKETISNLESQLNAPNIEEEIEKVLRNYLSVADKSMDENLIRSFVKEGNWAESVSQLSSILKKIHDIIPDLAEFILAEFTMTDVRTLLDMSHSSFATPENFDFMNRIFDKYGKVAENFQTNNVELLESVYDTFKELLSSNRDNDFLEKLKDSGERSLLTNVLTW